MSKDRDMGTVYYSSPQYKGPAIYDLISIERKLDCFSDEELREFEKQSRKMERELTQAHTAGIFLTAADLRE